MTLLFIQDIIDLFNKHLYLKLILDGYLALFITSFVVFLVIKYKKAANIVIIGALLLLFKYISGLFDLRLSNQLYSGVLTSYLVISAVLLAPDLRKLMEYHKSDDKKSGVYISSSQATKEAIGDAVFNLASQKVGALITIEYHMSLEQYSERAIILNSDISKELLEQIFIKDSPLHDGGVIIRGNKIVCAAAYYTLTQDQNLEKTVGSRHRAAVGISEVTDSFTIIVSEETGVVHVATNGIMKIMSSKNELLDYLSFYIGN